MSRPRPSARLSLLVLVGLGAAALVGCQPQSEGRPAGSIEVKNAQSSPIPIEAIKAKSSPRAR